MPVLTDTLADEIKGLTASVNGLRTDFAGFKGSVESDMRTIRWIGSFFAGILVMLVGAAVTLSWGASALNSKVDQQGGRLDKLEAKVDRLEQKVDDGFAKIIQRLDQVVPKPKP